MPVPTMYDATLTEFIALYGKDLFTNNIRVSTTLSIQHVLSPLLISLSSSVSLTVLLYFTYKSLPQIFCHPLTHVLYSSLDSLQMKSVKAGFL